MSTWPSKTVQQQRIHEMSWVDHHKQLISLLWLLLITHSNSDSRSLADVRGSQKGKKRKTNTFLIELNVLHGQTVVSTSSQKSGKTYFRPLITGFPHPNFPLFFVFVLATQDYKRLYTIISKLQNIHSSSYHIPEDRVENDGDHSNTKAIVMKVDVF